MPENQNPYNQSLIEYVKQLQQLNDIDLEVPQVDIADVIADPGQYGRDFVEAMFVKYYKAFIKAHKLGKKFARKNMDGG